MNNEDVRGEHLGLGLCNRVLRSNCSWTSNLVMSFLVAKGKEKHTHILVIYTNTHTQIIYICVYIYPRLSLFIHL